MRILLRTLFLLLPLALFSGGLCWVYTGNTGLSTAESILAVLAGAVILVSWEVRMLRQWALPALGDILARFLYSGHYCTADDELAQLVQRITAEQDPTLLHDHPGAQEFLRRAASLYPRTTYGRKAAEETEKR